MRPGNIWIFFKNPFENKSLSVWGRGNQLRQNLPLSKEILCPKILINLSDINCSFSYGGVVSTCLIVLKFKYMQYYGHLDEYF